MNDLLPQFPFSAAKLAAHTLLSEADFTLLRQVSLEENKDWCVVEGEIGLSARAAYRLLSCLADPPVRFELSRCAFGPRYTRPRRYHRDYNRRPRRLQ